MDLLKEVEKVYKTIFEYDNIDKYNINTLDFTNSEVLYSLQDLNKIPAISQSKYPNYNVLSRYIKNSDLKPKIKSLLWYISIPNYRFIDKNKNSDVNIDILDTIKTYAISPEFETFPQIVKNYYNKFFIKNNDTYLRILNSEFNNSYNVHFNTFQTYIKELSNTYYNPVLNNVKNRKLQTNIIKNLLKLLNLGIIPIVTYFMLSFMDGLIKQVILDKYVNKEIKITEENTLNIKNTKKPELISNLLNYSYYSYKNKNQTIVIKTKEWFINNVTMNDITDVVLLAINLGIKVKYMTKEEIYGFILEILDSSLTVENVNEIMLLQLKYFLPSSYNERILVQTNPILSLISNTKKYNQYINYYVSEMNIGLIFSRLNITKQYLELLSIPLNIFMRIVDKSYMEKYIKNLNLMSKKTYKKYKLELATKTYGDEYVDLHYKILDNDISFEEYEKLKSVKQKYLEPLGENLKTYKKQLIAKKDRLLENAKKEHIENEKIRLKIEELITIPQNENFVLKSINSNDIYPDTIVLLSLADIYYKHYLLYFMRLINIKINPYTVIYRERMLLTIEKKSKKIDNIPIMYKEETTKEIESHMSKDIIENILFYTIFNDVEINNKFSIVRMSQNIFQDNKWFLANSNAMLFFDNKFKLSTDIIDIEGEENMEVIFNKLYKKNLINLLIYNNQPYIPSENEQLDNEIIQHVLNNEVFYIDDDFEYQIADLEYYTIWLVDWQNNIRNYLFRLIEYYSDYTMLNNWSNNENKLFFVNRIQENVDGIVKTKYIAFSLQDITNNISEDKTYVKYPILNSRLKYSVRELRNILLLMKNAGIDIETQKTLENIANNQNEGEISFISKYYKDPVLKDLFKLYFATSLWIIHFVRYWRGPGYLPLNTDWNSFTGYKTDIFSRNPMVTFLVNYFFEIRDKITTQIEIFEEKENKNFHIISRDWESYIHLIAGSTEKEFLPDNFEMLVGKGKLFNINTLAGVIKRFFFNNYCMGFISAQAGIMQYTVAYYLELVKFLNNEDIEHLTDSEINNESEIITKNVTTAVNLLLKETETIISKQLIEKINNEISLQNSDIPDNLKNEFITYQQSENKYKTLIDFFNIVEKQNKELKSKFKITKQDEEIIIALNKIKESKKIIKQLKQNLIELDKDLLALPKNEDDRFLKNYILKTKSRIKDIENRNTLVDMSSEDLKLLPLDQRTYIQSEQKEAKSLQKNIVLLKSVPENKIKHLKLYTKEEKIYSNLIGKIKNVAISDRLNLFFLNISLIQILNKDSTNFNLEYYEINDEEKRYNDMYGKIYLNNVNKGKNMFIPSSSDPIFFDFYNPLNAPNTIKVSRFLKTIVNMGFDVKFKVTKRGDKIVHSELEESINNHFSNIMGSIFNPYSRIYLLNTLQRFLKLKEKDENFNIVLELPEMYRKDVRHTTDKQDEYGEHRIIFTTENDDDLNQYIEIIQI